MHHYLNTFLSFITQHAMLAYVAVFLVSFSESLALIGLLMPGTVIMFGVGAVVASGSLGLWPVLILAMAGAVAGDGVSYWLGHHYKERLASIWPFSRYPEMLNKGAAFFHRHGGKGVLFGRFVGPVRPVIPVVAGMLGMAPMHFTLVNVLSAIGWALVYILPGVFFGSSIAMAGAVSSRLAVVVFILGAGVWAVIWGARRMAFLVVRKGPVWFDDFKQWTTMKPSAHVVLRPVQRFFSFLLFQGRAEALPAAVLSLVFFMACWAFLAVLQDVMARDMVVADQAVYHFFQSLRTVWGDRIFIAITELGDAVVNISLACAVLIVLLVRRCFRTAGFWVLTALGGVIGVQLLKWIIHLPRPVEIYHGASSYGFPSGHTTMSVVLYSFLAILLAEKLSGTWRLGLFSGGLFISFMIGFSRLYLGAHWLSDVLAGYFIGISWTAFMGIAWLRVADEKVPNRLLSLAVILVVIIAGSRHVTQRHEKDLLLYAPRLEVKSLALSSWQTRGWQDLPAERIDMEGELEQPLIVQWAGPPDRLAGVLKAQGWRQPGHLDLKSVLGMFSSGTPVENLPVLPRFHDGRMERLRLIRIIGDHRFVFRLWDTGVEVNGVERCPLMAGTIEEQQGRSLAGLVLTAKETGDYDRPLALLAKTLAEKVSVMQVRREDKILQSRLENQQRWRGGVLLAW
ncbi:bifunctional DedA family/phosphatase PAP2 family protein [Desulfobacter curvatus]|uniref:bifunctional DedA family/phosphatase PAP2 family protein n=1 Tax=Desulfobacter curvatus TaxID=2290 RepID=UPI0003620B9B|nr:bifunctional DedA family/phosphatase PAP2 family protein [Desulfobacter curvatus]